MAKQQTSLNVTVAPHQKTIEENLPSDPATTTMNNHYLEEVMHHLQRSSQLASMTTSSFSASAGMMPKVTAAPRADDASDMAEATSNAISNQIPNTTNDAVATNGQTRPLWRNGEKTFPYKVYDMLEFAESSGNTNICSWLPSGDSFVIHDRKLFTEFILPRFFLHKKWRSFTRQLNIWCFKRDFSVTVSDAFCHPFFKRGDVAKLSCVERAESKNLFKKCPLTNKRKPPSTTVGATSVSKFGGEVQSVKKGSGGSVKTTSANATTKKRRVTSQDEEDVMDVASFLAGLKKNPDTPEKMSAPQKTPVEVAKSVEGVALINGNNNTMSSSNGSDKAEAMIASRMNLMQRQSSLNTLPYSDRQGLATSSIASLSQSSIRPTANPNLNIAGNSVMNNQTMNNQVFPMNVSFDSTFDRESLKRLSTEQLVALASRMKLREQMLRERAMSLQQAPVMPPMAHVATQGSGWGDAYPEMFLQHQQESRALQPRTLAGSMPSHGMLSQQGMVQSLMGSSKPKPSYSDIADLELQHASGIPNVSRNFGYPRAA
ncbi:hypothetical protein ACHAWT_008512 [Skeletonema menzelii]